MVVFFSCAFYYFFVCYLFVFCFDFLCVFVVYFLVVLFFVVVFVDICFIFNLNFNRNRQNIITMKFMSLTRCVCSFVVS